jgi:hypothetical protein
MLKIIETIYGPELAVYVTQVQDKLVYTVGYTTTDALKAQIDKLLDKKAGDLVCSPAWRSATAGLPGASSGVMMFSLADTIKNVLTKVVAQLDPQVPQAAEAVKFDKPSGVGISFGPAPKGVIVYVNVPMQEMENIKTLILAMQPKPVPPPAEKPAAGEGNPPGGEKKAVPPAAEANPPAK